MVICFDAAFSCEFLPEDLEKYTEVKLLYIITALRWFFLIPYLLSIAEIYPNYLFKLYNNLL